MPYRLVLQDGGVLDGDLYFVFWENSEKWQAAEGIDWHLQDDPIKKVDTQTVEASSVSELPLLGRLFDAIQVAYSEKDWAKVDVIAESIRDAFRKNEAYYIGRIGRDKANMLEDLSDELHDAIRDKKLYLAPAYHEQLIKTWIDCKMQNGPIKKLNLKAYVSTNDGYDDITDNIIVPGKHVGRYTFGMSKDDVLESLGKPKLIFYGEKRYALGNLPKIYYMLFDNVSFRIIDDSVKEITAISPFYRLASGLGVGDSEQKIRQAFGDDFDLKKTEKKDFLTYEDEGLVFEIDKNDRTVMEINVSPIRQDVLVDKSVKAAFTHVLYIWSEQEEPLYLLEGKVYKDIEKVVTHIGELTRQKPSPYLNVRIRPESRRWVQKPLEQLTLLCRDAEFLVNKKFSYDLKDLPEEYREAVEKNEPEREIFLPEILLFDLASGQLASIEKIMVEMGYNTDSKDNFDKALTKYGRGDFFYDYKGPTGYLFCVRGCSPQEKTQTNKHKIPNFNFQRKNLPLSTVITTREGQAYEISRFKKLIRTLEFILPS